MAREKDPFHGREQSQDGRRRKYEYDLEYEDEYELYGDAEDDEYEDEDMSDQSRSNIPRRRSATPLPPFPSTNRNIYPRRSRASRMPRSTQPTPHIQPKRPTHTTRSVRQTYLPNEPLPSSRHSAGSYHRPPQPTARMHTDDFPRRPVSAKPRKHRVWPIFLIGCAAGAVSLVLAIFIFALMGIRSVQNGINIPGIPNAGKPFSKQISESVPLSTLSQLIVCNPAGNISLGIDPNPSATAATIKATKLVHAVDQNEANRAFEQITVDTQSQQPPACQKTQAPNTSALNTAPTPVTTDNTVLAVNTTFPPNQAGQTATVDLAITLPLSSVHKDSPTSTAIAIQAPYGNIDVNGLSGVMTLKGLAGDITVQHAVLVDGSKLEAQGTLKFDGSIWKIPLPTNKRAGLFFRSATLINLTLPEITPVTIDATLNVRTAKITSDFPVKVVTNGDGASTYRGPFNPAVPPDEKKDPVLTLLASSGNISLHKS